MLPQKFSAATTLIVSLAEPEDAVAVLVEGVVEHALVEASAATAAAPRVICTALGVVRRAGTVRMMPGLLNGWTDPRGASPWHDSFTLHGYDFQY
jgi:hypothetical protein